VGGGYLLIATENNTIVGTVSLIERQKGKFHYASHDNLAISNKMKGKGVARIIFEEALRISKENDYDFLVSFTATNALSSVKYHKRVGFIIYAKSYGDKYNSYSFIYPIRRLKFLRFSLINRPIYAMLKCVGYIKNKFRK
jgi:L-amino acid N-acyltransferase YncA